MKILMINKFLHPNGGSETYLFKLGKCLEEQGNEVQYFGMEHEGRCVGNRVGAYTGEMDFHGGSRLRKLTYPVRTIYSGEARKRIRLVLDDFQPDVPSEQLHIPDNALRHTGDCEMAQGGRPGVPNHIHGT